MHCAVAAGESDAGVYDFAVPFVDDNSVSGSATNQVPVENSSPLWIGYSKSPKFSQLEIESAVEAVIEKFKDFKGCELRKLWFDESESDIRVQTYLTNGRGPDTGATQENTIVLLSDFYVSPTGGDGSLNRDSSYTDWMWILIRDNADSNWVVDDWGF